MDLKNITYKAVQIGCGERGHFHARALQSTEGIEFTGACDLDIAKAEKVADLHSVPNVYSDYRKLIESLQPEIIALITPPSIRRSIILPLLEYKPKILVIEKPIACGVKEAEELVAAANAAGTRLLVCHECRYADEMKGMKSLIDSGRLGNIRQITATCRLNLMLQGTHIIDLIGMMLDERVPSHILAQMDGSSDFHGEHASPSHTLLQITYPENIVAWAAIGSHAPELKEQAAKKSLQFEVSVLGDDGYVRAVLGYGWNAFLRDGEIINMDARLFDEDSYMTGALYRDVVEVLNGHLEVHPCDGQRALEVQRVIGVAYESARRGRALSLPRHPSDDERRRIKERLIASRDIAVSTLIYGSHSRYDILRELSNSGFESIDLWMHPEHANHFDLEKGEDPENLKKELDALGLNLNMISVYSNDPERLRSAIEAGYVLGANIVVTMGLHPERHPGFATEIRPVLDLAAKRGLRIAFENHINELETIADIEVFLRTIDHPAASLCLAPPHLLLFDERPEDALVRLGKQISVFYLWDTDPDLYPHELDVLLSNADAQIPGSNLLDFEQLLKLMISHAPEAICSYTWHGSKDWPLSRITNSLHRAERHIERSRPQ